MKISALSALSTLATLASVLSTTAQAIDVRANQCEIFVSKARAVPDSHGMIKIQLFLKTQNQKLDGEIASVGFLKYTGAPEGCGYPTYCETYNLGKWTTDTARPFAGSSDYFDLTLTLDHDYMPALTFEGAFFVETKNGTRYFANSAEGSGNFMIDSNMYRNLFQAQGGYEASFNDVGRLREVADIFPYLNPQGCR